jgi:hypothetical protein
MQPNHIPPGVPFLFPSREETIQLQKKFRNKTDLYKYLTCVLVSNHQQLLPMLIKPFFELQHLFLPTPGGCPLIYLQQIMSLTKAFFRRSEVRQFQIPMWPELAVSKIWSQAALQPTFLTYLPDTWTATKKTERDFFWAILVTIQPDYVENLINDCRRQRDALRIGPRPPPVR